VPAGFDDLVRTRINCRLVRVRGVVRTADIVSTRISPTGRLQLLMDGGYVELHLARYDPLQLKKLLDAEVEVTGSAGRLFDGKMQQTGVKIKVSSLASIKVLKRTAANPWTLPVTPLGGIISGYHVRDLSKRIRVHGTITYSLPGAAAVLQNESSSLWVSTQSDEPLQVGDVADAVGFPGMDDHRLTLIHAEVLDSGIAAPVRPMVSKWSQLATWARNAPSGHAYDLVSIDGRVVTEIREAAQDEYVLKADGRLFTAIFRHPPPPRPLPPMLDVPLGSIIRVTGICMIVDSTPFNGEAPFNVLLRSFDDIEVVSRPPWLNVRHLLLIVGLLLGAIIAVGIRSWALERRVRQKTAALAYLERRRSLILEAINRSRPLSEIIEQITEVVSFRLHGTACWCEVADCERLGKRPAKITSQRIIQKEIPGRSGAALGTIFAAVNRLKQPSPDESEALALGAGLATLAIETSRLYSNLVYRSEFDLLTDIPNRFSLEKQLDALSHDRREVAGAFGFIFIDLDRFKRVNDDYGHQVGDLYLQQAAQRMKRQLRPGDTLARLGGDEFAVVVPAVCNRNELDEIANRLEHCFDEQFALEGHVVYGSASVGVALYPDDAASADSLLSKADAAMYAVKQSRHNSKRISSSGPISDLLHCA
ncbi:MAG: GGDEF domain-containing protein, partial [Terracidiphilus sp.]